MIKTEQDIIPLIPQKPPFVMAGKLLYADETITRTSFIIEEANVLVINGLFAEAGLMENIAQTAAAGAGYNATLQNKPVQAGYIGAVKNFEVFELPKVNDEIITEIRIEEQIFGVTLIAGSVTCNNKIIASCEMKIFMNAVE